MTPDWLANENKSQPIEWNVNFTKEDLHLKIDPDSRDYECVVSVSC